MTPSLRDHLNDAAASLNDAADALALPDDSEAAIAALITKPPTGVIGRHGRRIPAPSRPRSCPRRGGVTRKSLCP
jgi:hypothetical protein